MRIFRRKTINFWIVLFISGLFLVSPEGQNAAAEFTAISLLLAVGYYVFFFNIEVSNQSIKIGRKEIKPSSIKRAEFKTKFIGWVNEGLTLLEKNPEPNNYVLKIYLTTIGEEVNIILGQYNELESLVKELERFFIDNSITYEKEDFKNVYIA